jgi:hypothetical protein
VNYKKVELLEVEHIRGWGKWERRQDRERLTKVIV